MFFQILNENQLACNRKAGAEFLDLLKTITVHLAHADIENIRANSLTM